MGNQAARKGGGMKEDRPFSNDPRLLRPRAEERLAAVPAAAPDDVLEPLSPDSLRLIHELQVHQIELEMQGEELLKTQGELEAGLERYRSLYDFAPVGYLSLDRAGAIRQVNLCGARLLGADRSQLVAGRLVSFLAPSSRPTFEAFLATAFEARVKQTCELETLSAGDMPRWLEIAASVADGADECKVVAKDVSERRRAEERIQRLNRVLEVLSRTSRIIIRGKNIRAVFKRACRVAVEIGGYRRAGIGRLEPDVSIVSAMAWAGVAENEGRDVPVFPLAASEAADPVISALRKGKHVVCSDLESAPRKRAWREIAEQSGSRSVAVFPLRLRGQVCGALSLFAGDPDFFCDEEIAMLDELAQDLSFAWEQAEAEESRKVMDLALRESEERYRTLFAGSRDAVMVLTEDEGFGAGNPATIELFRCRDEEDFKGRTPEDLSPDTQPDGAPSAVKMGQMMNLALETGSHFFEWTYRRTDGSEFPATVLLSRVEIDGRPVFYSTVRDISLEKHAEAERKKLEAQLLQAAKMEAVGRLAGGVAHDFNTLLTVILGNATLAMDENPDERVGRFLVDIERSAHRATAVTSQLLAYSRRHVVELRVLDINAVVPSIVNMLRRLLGENVHVEMSLAPCLWPVKVESSLTEQIIMNLALNARDAMPEGGEVTIETRNVSVEPEDPEDIGTMSFGGDSSSEGRHRVSQCLPDLPPGDYVVLSVSDTGTGMDEATLAQLFEPFFTTKQAAGTGLGLSTVHRMVKQHKGRIEVKSAPGEGTTFAVYLPRSRQRLVDDATTSARATLPRGTETLLLVEDDPDLAAIQRLFLEPLGYTLLLAATGESALRVADGHDGPIHLLVTDVGLPGINGPELARRLVEARPETPVLFVSGYTQDALGHEGLVEESVRFLAKPYSRKKLAYGVRAALDEGRTPSATTGMVSVDSPDGP